MYAVTKWIAPKNRISQILVIVLKNRSNEIRSNEIRIRQEPPENRNGHCAFILSGADINNGPLPAQSTFIAQIFIDLFGNSGPKTKQKNGLV